MSIRVLYMSREIWIFCMRIAVIGIYKETLFTTPLRNNKTICYTFTTFKNDHEYVGSKLTLIIFSSFR